MQVTDIIFLFDCLWFTLIILIKPHTQIVFVYITVIFICLHGSIVQTLAMCVITLLTHSLIKSKVSTLGSYLTQR